jgi:hypothetical protein
MDEPLRVSLWNVFYVGYLESDAIALHNSPHRLLLRDIWSDFFGQRLDGLPAYISIYRENVRAWFDGLEWHRVYAFIEFVSETDVSAVKAVFRKACQVRLERHMSGYRFVGDIIVPITDEMELNEIETARESARGRELGGARVHLDTALILLADRVKPDYRNSIKEAISAVESLLKVIVADESLTLGQALSRVNSKGILELHPLLRQSLDKLYGYTNDQGGIRHALLDEPDVAFPEAKFMLVVASAAVNLLVLESEEAGLSLTR